MNERIRLLAEKAGIYKLDLSDETEYWIIEKFAELIVQECAQVAADFVPGYGLVPFSKRFKEHYGVEK